MDSDKDIQQKILNKLSVVAESVALQYPNHTFSLHYNDDELNIVIDDVSNKFKVLGYPHKVTKRQFIRIEFEDGKVIQKSTALASLIEFVNYVGPESARKAGIKHGEVELISDKKDIRYASRQKPLGDGYYLFTKTDIQVKVDDINRIAKTLGLNLSAEVLIEISHP